MGEDFWVTSGFAFVAVLAQSQAVSAIGLPHTAWLCRSLNRAGSPVQFVNKAIAEAMRLRRNARWNLMDF
jgi:hypothetical protein